MSGASVRFNACMLILAAAALAIMGDWEPSLAGLWRLPAALLLLGLAYESWIVSKGHLAVELQAPENLYLGRAAAIRFICSRSLKRTVSIEIARSAPEFFDIESSVDSLQVKSGERAAIERRVVPKRLGSSEWPPLRTRSAGPLGLAWWPRQVACPAAVRVLPALFRNTGEVKGVSALGSSATIDPGAGPELCRLPDSRSA